MFSPTMQDGSPIDAVTSNAASFVPSSSQVVSVTGYLILVAAVCAVGFLAYYVWRQFQYKHTVIIQKKAGKGKHYVFDKAWIKKRNGNIYWELRGTKEQIESPPDECIEISKNGNYVLNCALDSDGTYIYLESTYDFFEKAKDREDYEPAGTQSRNAVYRMLRKNSEHRGEDGWFSKNATAILATISLVFILVGGGFGAQLVLEPSLQVANQAQAISENQVEYLEVLQEIKNDVTNLNRQQANTVTNVSEVPN